jgi:single-strand DNA-binding protein
MRNKVQLIGNLGMDPEVVTFNGNKELAKFSLATNETYRNASGEKVMDTQWHNIVAFGKTATIIKSYLKKGSEVAVEGKLVNKSYEDKNGVKRYTTEIIVSEVLLLGGKEKN